MEEIKKWKRVTGDDRVALRARVVKLYEGGSSIRAISSQTGRSYGAIYRLLGESSVQLRPRGNPLMARTEPQD